MTAAEDPCQRPAKIAKLSEYQADELERMPPSAVKKYYDDIADAYDGICDHRGYGWHAALSKSVLEFCLPKLDANATEPLQFLDVGCGTAKAWEDLLTHESARLARINFHGCDLSPGNLEICKGKTSIPFATNGLKEVNLIEYPWPYATGQFDVVVCVGCFIHLKQNPEMLHEFARITKTGGFILFGHRNDTYPSFQQVDEKLLRETYRLIDATPYRQLYVNLPRDHEDAKVKFTIHTLQRLEKIAASPTNCSLIVLTTNSWTQTYFRKLILPNSRCSDLSNIKFFDAQSEPLEKLLPELVALLETMREPRCFAITDAAMELLSCAREQLRGKVELTGAHLLSFQLATNKLACRRLVSGCGGIKFEAVLSGMSILPDIALANFFKPLAGVASKGIMKFNAGTQTPNPLQGTKNTMAEFDVVLKLSKACNEITPYMCEDIVGLVEEYVDPSERLCVINVDGFVSCGKIYHYVLGENIYKLDSPEVFDYIVVPSQTVKSGSEQAQRCWELYDKVVGDLIRRGLDNQFVNYEGFIFPDGRVEVMEINCRTFANAIPLFSKVYGKSNCMYAAAIDLLSCKLPAFSSELPLPDSDKIGVCVYGESVDGAGVFAESESGDISYYCPKPGAQSFLYGSGENIDMIALVSKCREFHATLSSKFCK